MDVALDPLTHTFVGASLSAAGLRRATPLATATLVLGANAPDVDIVVQAFGPYTGLAWRRGITHGIPALIALPFAVAGLVLAWDRWIRRRRRSDAPPARPLPLLGLAAIGVWTHPALDWLNTYGMRWWLPLDGSWSYGDAVFIVDPWLWLLLGGGLFFVHSTGRASWAAWAALAGVLSLLVLGTGVAPPAAMAVWVVGLGGWIVLRARARPTSAATGERVVRGAVGFATLYILVMVGQTVLAERTTLTEARELGVHAVEDLMVGPVPADPFRSEVVLRTPEGYYRGAFSWLSVPRLRLEPEVLAHHPRDEVVQTAERHPHARDFLVWSRFPWVTADPAADGGWIVEFRDVRYLGRGALGGPTIHVPPDPQGSTEGR